jgi:hypothetical protein
MSLKQNLNIVTSSLTDTVVNSTAALGQVVTIVNKGASYVNKELDDLLADQEAVGSMKTAYRTVLVNKANDAVNNADEDSILEAAEKLIKGLENFSNL